MESAIAQAARYGIQMRDFENLMMREDFKRLRRVWRAFRLQFIDFYYYDKILDAFWDAYRSE